MFVYSIQTACDKGPITKKGYFKKSEVIYDEYFDCYIYLNNEILKYTTTNREGYREEFLELKKNIIV